MKMLVGQHFMKWEFVMCVFYSFHRFVALEEWVIERQPQLGEVYLDDKLLVW